MSTPAELRFRRDARVPFQEIDGRAVIVVPARREMHELDEVATFLWKELAAARTLDALAEAVVDAYEVEPARAAADVRAFVAGLEEKGLAARA